MSDAELEDLQPRLMQHCAHGHPKPTQAVQGLHQLQRGGRVQPAGGLIEED